MFIEWKRLIIKGHKTIYEISNDGQIRNMFGRINKGNILSDFITKTGYHRIGLWYKGKQKKFFVHWLVSYMFVDGYSKRLQVNHKDGNKSNNYFENLEWVTGSENILHAFENGLQVPPIGSKNGMSKNKEEDIVIVCEYLELGYTIKEIFNITGISKSVIESVKKGQRWKHISKEYDFIKSKKRKRFNDYRKDDTYDVDLDDNYIYSISGILMTS